VLCGEGTTSERDNLDRTRSPRRHGAIREWNRIPVTSRVNSGSAVALYAPEFFFFRPNVGGNWDRRKNHSRIVEARRAANLLLPTIWVKISIHWDTRSSGKPEPTEPREDVFAIIQGAPGGSASGFPQAAALPSIREAVAGG